MTHITVDTARTGPLLDQMRRSLTHILDSTSKSVMCDCARGCSLWVEDLAALLSPEGGVGEQTAKPASSAIGGVLLTRPWTCYHCNTLIPAHVTHCCDRKPTPPDTRLPGQRAFEASRDCHGWPKGEWANEHWHSRQMWEDTARIRGQAQQAATKPPQPPAEAGVGAGERDGGHTTPVGPLRARVEALEGAVARIEQWEMRLQAVEDAASKTASEIVPLKRRLRALGEGL